MNNIIYLKSHLEKQKLAEECIRQQEVLERYTDQQMSIFLEDMHILVSKQLEDQHINKQDISNTIAMFIEQFINGVNIK
jgi:hypothetical protein